MPIFALILKFPGCLFLGELEFRSLARHLDLSGVM
jgi:hypothetical protein